MVVLVLFSCKKNDDVPETIIGKEQMAKILVDIHLLEIRIDKLDMPKDSADVVYKSFEYDLLTNKHNVDTLTYLTSFKYYTNHLNHFNDVYDMVLKEMEIKQKDRF